MGINFIGIVGPVGQKVGDWKSKDQMGFGPNASRPDTSGKIILLVVPPTRFLDLPPPLGLHTFRFPSSRPATKIKIVLAIDKSWQILTHNKI